MDTRRTLAAIVFTDVVNFTGRVADAEAHMLELVKRDLAMMSECCAKFEGRVLKNTGDGLLMHFTSAVAAVKCAVRIQKVLADAEQTLTAQDVLKHRIGIHLGDVFVSDDDVMGEGVNIASRLQQQAKPGGICFSQTVYDVVKNKIAVRAAFLGPTELKHIREKVPVYQIVSKALGEQSDAPSEDLAGRARTRKAVWIGVGAAALLVLAGAFAVFRSNRPGRPKGPVESAANGLEAGIDDQGLTVAQLLERYDANGDGKLAPAEVPRMYRDKFFGADTDRDGLVTSAELDAARGRGDDAARSGPRGRRRGSRMSTLGPRQVFERFDHNRDDQLERGELPAQVADRLFEADANNDGVLSRPEVEDHHRNDVTAPARTGR